MTLWQWLLTFSAIAGLIAISLVAYFIIVPGHYSILWSDLALYFSIFPLLPLVCGLTFGVLAAIAKKSKAKLALICFCGATILSLMIAAFPTLGMLRLTEVANIPTSLYSHFGISRHPTEYPPRVSKNVSYGTTTELLLDIWPATKQGELHPAFVRVHGGGWASGNKGDMNAWNQWLNELGYVVFDVEYRMQGNERWIEEVSDVKCALGWVFVNAKRYDVDPARISIMGNSAGGNLAMLAAYSMGAANLSPSCDVPEVAVKSVVNLYGPSDLVKLDTNPISPEYAMVTFKNYLGGRVEEFPDRFKTYSPINYITSKTPPTITIMGTSDRLVREEQAQILIDALKAAGIYQETYFLPGVDHAFDVNWNSLATQYSRAKIKAFLEKKS